jgi:hypothetical protein
VAIEVAAGFVPRTNGVAGAPRFALRTERVLHGRIHLPLQLQEIRDVEIFGFEPAQESVVVLTRAGQMDVVVGSDPILGRAFGPVVQLQGHAESLPRLEVELRARGHVEQSAVRFEPIVALRQIVSAAALQQNEV